MTGEINQANAVQEKLQKAKDIVNTMDHARSCNQGYIMRRGLICPDNKCSCGLRALQELLSDTK